MKAEQLPEGGVLTYIEDFKYPLRALPLQDNLHFVDMLKRVLIESTRFLLSFPITPKRFVNALVKWMGEIYFADVKIRDGVRFNPAHYSQSTREILRVLLKINAFEDTRWIYYIVVIWDTDMAYRCRGQDILAELDKEKLAKNPRKEIIRLYDICVERELAGVKPKLLLFRKLLVMALFSRKVKSKIKEFLMELDVKEVDIDINDRYWTANKFDYNYQGKTYEERMKWREEEDRNWERPVPEPERPRIALYPLNDAFYALSQEEAQKMADSTSKVIMDTYNAHVQA